MGRRSVREIGVLFQPPAAIASSKDDAALAGGSSPLGGSGEILDIEVTPLISLTDQS